MGSRRKGTRYGYGERVITPAVKVSLAGYFGQRIWDIVLDDLFVKALYLDGALLVVYDLCYISPDIVLAVKKAARAHGIADEHVIACATHTHTGPSLDEATGGAKGYNAFLIERTHEVVDDAVANVREGRLAVGSFEESRFAFNRRYWMKEGGVVTNPGKLNPAIDKPEGGIDASVQIAGLYADERLDTLLVNLSNHVDTIGGNGVSADWPGVLRGYIKEKTGVSRVIVATSPSGNINHFDVRSGESQTRYEEAQRIGTGYGESVVRFIHKDMSINGNGNLAEVSSYELRTAVNGVRILPRAVSAAELEQAKKDAALGVPMTSPLTSEDLARKTPAAVQYFAERLLAYERTKKPAAVTMTGIAIGEFRLLSFPGEPFHEIAREMRRHTPGVFVTQLTGAEFKGYIPMRECYPRGGYETQVRSSPCEADTSDKLIASGLKILGTLTRVKNKRR